MGAPGWMGGLPLRAEPGVGAAVVPAGAAEAEATAEADGAGTAIPGTAQVTLAKRLALWKLPCPRMGDQATPELFFIP